MNATFKLIATLAVMAMVLLSGCGTAPTPVDQSALVSTLVAQTVAAQQPAASPTPNLQTQVAQSVAATLGAPAGQPTNPPTANAVSGATQAAPPAACREQMLGPWQPPSSHEYWYVQINEEFLDSDYLVSLYYEKVYKDLSGWLVQGGIRGEKDPIGTEIVYTVRRSIIEVQFANPTSGVGWRLCAHPDAQLGQEARDHANRIAAARTWLRVYDVGDLWLSLQTGDQALINLIKCIDPPTQGIPSCQNP